MRSEGKGRKPDHVESHLHLIFSTSLLTHGEARATSKDANTVIQVRQDVGLPQDASSGGAEKRSDRGYIVKVEVTNFLIDQIWAVREREASRLTPDGLGPATGRIELTWVRPREEQIEGRKQVFRLVHLKASWLFGGKK